jgi:hypothetical protein
MRQRKRTGPQTPKRLEAQERSLRASSRWE